MTFDDALLVIVAMADDMPTIAKGQLCRRAAEHMQNMHLAVIQRAEESQAALAKLQGLKTPPT